MKSQSIHLLMQRQWRENSRGYIIGLLALLVIFIFSFAITWHFRNSFSGDTNRGIFLLGLFGGGSIFASSIFRDLASPARAVWQICLPSSIAEKIFIAIAFGVIGYLICFLACYYVVEYLFRLSVSDRHTFLPALDLFKNGFYNFIFSFINLQLLMLTGSIAFKKAAFLKSLLLIICVFAVSNFLNNHFLGFLTNEKNINGGNLFDYFQFVHQGENVYVNMPESIDTITVIFFHFLLPTILGCIMYYKLKETELT